MPKLPRLSLKTLLYFFLLVTILILVAEGGYFWGLEKGKKSFPQACPSQPAQGVEPVPISSYQEGVFRYLFSRDSEGGGWKRMMAGGKIEEIDPRERTILLTSLNQSILVHIASEAEFEKVDPDAPLTSFSPLEEGFSQLKVGDVVDVGDLFTGEGGVLYGRTVTILTPPGE